MHVDSNNNPTHFCHLIDYSSSELSQIDPTDNLETLEAMPLPLNRQLINTIKIVIDPE